MNFGIFCPIAELVFVHRTPQFDLPISNCIIGIARAILELNIPHTLEGMEAGHFLIDPVWALIRNGWPVDLCLVGGSPLVPERDAIWLPIKLGGHASKLAVQNGPSSISNYFAGSNSGVLDGSLGAGLGEGVDGKGSHVSGIGSVSGTA